MITHPAHFLSSWPFGHLRPRNPKPRSIINNYQYRIGMVNMLWRFVKYCLLLTVNALVSILAMRAQGAETITIDFEGLSPGPLTGQIPGLLFENVTVERPAIIGNSASFPLSAATSGTSAAFTFGALIHFNFSKPVIRVQMSVSPQFITVPLDMVGYYYPAYLVAYKSDGTEITRSQTRIIEAVARQEDLTNFTPATISVSSATPISYVSIDLDDPFNIGGYSFYFDDLILTVGQQVPPTRPTIYIEPWRNGQVLLSWDFFNSESELQWTTNFATGPWETIRTTNTTSYLMDATKVRSMFFRVNRLLPPT